MLNPGGVVEANRTSYFILFFFHKVLYIKANVLYLRIVQPK